MKHFLLSALTVPACVTSAFAAHYDVKSEISKAPRQVLVQDLLWSSWTRGHYLACYSQRFRTQENWGGYFYGGIVGDVPAKKTLIQICSWQMSGKGAPPAAIDFVQAGKHMSWAKSTWEGSAGGIKGKWPHDELRAGTWYRTVARTWAGPGEKPDHSFIGVWMKDTGTGEWYHLGTTRYPGVIRDLGDHFGFQENFIGGNADPIASVMIRNTYSRRNGEWVADNKVQLRPQRKEREKITPMEGGTALKLETLWDDTKTAKPADVADPAFVNKNNDFIYKQPAQPNFLDACAATGVSAARAGSQLYVKWTVPVKAAPQLGWRIEVFDNAERTGAPVKTFRADEPDTREALLDIGDIATPFVRLTLSDIYDGVSRPADCSVMGVKPIRPVVSSKLSRGTGLDYVCYEAPEKTVWTALPDFEKLPPAFTGVVGEPDISPRRRRENYAFRFDGALKVSVPGIHRFTLISGGGSRLLIDGRTVIDFDGPHSINAASGAIPLTAGSHDFRLEYFQGARQQQQADDFLQLSRTGPDTAGKPVRVGGGDFEGPTGFIDSRAVTLRAPSGGALVGATSVPLEAAVAPDAAPAPIPASIRYYMTNPDFDYFAGQGARGAQYFLGETSGASGKLVAPVWGPGAKTVFARAVYADGHTVDSSPVSFTTMAGDLGPWKLTELEHHQYPVAARVDGDTVSLVGESMALLTQPVKGDCEITAHLAEITPNVPGPDGTRPEAGVWQAGVILRHNLEASPGEPLGGNTHYTSVLAKVNGDVAFCDSLMKNGAGNQPSGNQGSKNRWMRITRRGAVCTNSVSEDGQTWKVVKTVELPKLGETAHAGFFLYALPSATLSLHRAKFDHITVTTAPVSGNVAK
jgi:hypothetical protein